MALIRFGGGVVQMSGSIAGDTFARNRFGNYNRARTVPTNPNTSRQIKVRSSLAQLVQRWGDTLTAAQRAAWNNYAQNVNMLNRLGEVIQLSGFNHYVRSNTPLLQNDLSPVDDGPSVLSLPEKDPTFAISASVATGLISVTFDDTFDWCDEDAGHMIVYEGEPQKATRNFFKGPWQLCDTIDGNSTTPPTSPETMTAVHTLIEGQRLWCYGRIAREDGRISGDFAADCIIAA